MAEGDPPPKDAAEETGLEEEDLFEDFALINGAGASWPACAAFPHWFANWHGCQARLSPQELWPPA